MSITSSTGIREILSTLDDVQILNLARTVTLGLLKGSVHTREDALKVILQYSTNEVAILRRRAISKEMLFTYLHANNVTIPVSPTKDKLIDLVCTLWNIQNQEIQSQPTELVAKVDKHDDEYNVSSMAKQFSQWFYEMMNLDEPIETTHFFPDAMLSLTIYEDNSTLQEDICLPNEFVQLLFNIKVEQQWIFHPNLTTKGVRGVENPCGSVVILVCGTLHSRDLCVGVFEQIFSLAKDPSCEHNWKIKMTEVNLKKMHVSQEPTLGYGSFSPALVPFKYED